jgi:hypothetical protein
MNLRPLALLAVLVVAGCGSSAQKQSQPQSAASANPKAKEVSPSGDIPDNQAYVAFTPPGANFSVKVPEGWSQTTKSGAVSFTDKLNSIRMESASGGAVSLAQAKQDAQSLQSAKVSTVSRKAGTAVRTTFLQAAAPNPVTGKAGTDAVERYVFSHGGKRVTLTLSGPKGADNVDPWRIVTDSLTWSR